MTKAMKTVIALMSTLCIMLTLVPICVYGDTPDKPDTPPSGDDTETTDETAVLYDYVYFGSYPQREVVSQAGDSGVYGKAWASNDDYIIDADLYNELKGLEADAWDANGDTTLNGNKYRRIKQSDVTSVCGDAPDSSSGDDDSGDDSSGKTKPSSPPSTNTSANVPTDGSVGVPVAVSADSSVELSVNASAESFDDTTVEELIDAAAEIPAEASDGGTDTGTGSETDGDTESETGTGTGTGTGSGSGSGTGTGTGSGSGSGTGSGTDSGTDSETDGDTESETDGDTESETTEKTHPTSDDEKDPDKYYTWSSDETSSADTYHYFKYEPIKWRVLQRNGDDFFLLSEIVLDDQMFNTELNGSVTWETSTIRSWLNGYGSSENTPEIDYTSSNFINTAFTAEEQEKINATTIDNKYTVSNEDEGQDYTVKGADTTDKIYLLSDDEVYGNADAATAYGFKDSADKEDTARQVKSSTYAKAMGLLNDTGDNSGNCHWWLRSPGSHPGLYIYVRESGSVYVGGQHANSRCRGVRPAMHVTLSLAPFDGASLRRRVLVSDETKVAADCTDIRLSFTFDLPSGAAVDTAKSCFYWTRDGQDPTNASSKVTMKNYVKNENGSYTASLVLTNVPKASFDTTIKAMLHVEYSVGGSTTTLDSVIASRSVTQVINALAAEYTDEGNANYTWGQYARYLKGTLTSYSIS